MVRLFKDSIDRIEEILDDNKGDILAHFTANDGLVKLHNFDV